VRSRTSRVARLVAGHHSGASPPCNREVALCARILNGAQQIPTNPSCCLPATELQPLFCIRLIQFKRYVRINQGAFVVIPLFASGSAPVHTGKQSMPNSARFHNHISHLGTEALPRDAMATDRSAPGLDADGTRLGHLTGYWEGRKAPALRMGRNDKIGKAHGGNRRANCLTPNHGTRGWVTLAQYIEISRSTPPRRRQPGFLRASRQTTAVAAPIPRETSQAASSSPASPCLLKSRTAVISGLAPLSSKSASRQTLNRRPARSRQAGPRKTPADRASVTRGRSEQATVRPPVALKLRPFAHPATATPLQPD
jgi:hypothetical protein